MSAHGSLNPRRSLSCAALFGWCVALAACRTSEPGHTASAGDTVASARVVRHASDGVFTGAQAERGSVLYQSFCQECHQPDLSGAKGPALTGTEFLQRWGAPGLSVADLFGFVTSLMPEYEPGSLTEQEYADVLAFILRENGYGAGLGELARDIEQLETVVLDRLSAIPDSGRR